MMDAPGAIVKKRYLLQVLLVAIAAFNLGRYSVEFSGSTLAWIGVACWLIVLAGSVVVFISMKLDA
jgi:hypothetical protein